MKRIHQTAASGLLVLALAPDLCAHGGMYRGPGEVVPPTASGSGSSGGGSAPGSGWAGPASSGPGTGGGSGGAGPAAAGAVAAPTAAAGPRGMPIGEDLTRWSYWWEFHKDPFLKLKETVHQSATVVHSDEFYMGARRGRGVDTLRPTRSLVLESVVPALHRMLESTDQRDITSSCLVALAKIGLEDAEHPLLPALRARLVSHDQEIRETAALALGISQKVAALPDLMALALDTQQGRGLVERSRVDDRTRSFAAYGLGLVAWSTPSPRVKRQVLDALREVLEDETIANWSPKVAAINAIGLLRPEGIPAGEGGLRRVVRDDALDVLERYYLAERGVGEQLVQAHVPPAAAALLESDDGDALRERWKEILMFELRGDRALGPNRRHLSLGQSAAMALARLADPNEPGAKDQEISAALLDFFHRGQDEQTAYFALIALAEIDGSQNRAALLKALKTGTKALEKPWAALALGVYENRRLARTGFRDRPDETIGRAILAEMQRVKNPETLAAFAVALGLARYGEAAPHLRELLKKHRSKDQLAGYLCIGLSLMNDRQSIGPIREIVAGSVRRPQLLLQAAIALGKLGDKRAADLLLTRLSQSEQNIAAMASLAFAIGQIGDRRSIDPLIATMENESLTALARAFAAVALGGVADKELEPWNAKIARSVNYRSAVETLTNQVSGILDIL